MQLYIMASAVLSKTTKTVSIVAVCFLLYYYNLYRIGYSYTICFYGALSATPPTATPNHGTRHICTSESTPYPLVRTSENCVRTELLEDRPARLADGQTTEIRSERKHSIVSQDYSPAARCLTADKICLRYLCCLWSEVMNAPFIPGPAVCLYKCDLSDTSSSSPWLKQTDGQLSTAVDSISASTAPFVLI